MPTACAPVSPWPYCVATWMLTPSGLWAAGKATLCFAISIPRPYRWCSTSPALCLPTALSLFSLAPTYHRAPSSPHPPTLNWLGAALLWGRDCTSKAGYRQSPSNTLATWPTDDEQLATQVAIKPLESRWVRRKEPHLVAQKTQLERIKKRKQQLTHESVVCLQPPTRPSTSCSIVVGAGPY